MSCTHDREGLCILFPLPTLSRVRGEGALFIFLLRHRQGVSEELRRDAIYRVSSIAKFLDAINRVST